MIVMKNDFRDMDLIALQIREPSILHDE